MWQFFHVRNNICQPYEDIKTPEFVIQEDKNPTKQIRALTRQVDEAYNLMCDS